jgi:AcrR family transcriptional regulator
VSTPGKRSVGRPRHFDDEHERNLIFDAGYTALRDHGHDFTVAEVLKEAGVSTRSFYRHFESKDALLCAMYLRDAEWAAARLAKRLAAATSPVHSVELWIEGIFAFRGNARRAERVAVLGSIAAMRANGAAEVAAASRKLLTESLAIAIEAGVRDGSFRLEPTLTVELASELVGAATMYAAGLATPTVEPLDRIATTAFCLGALGCALDGS